MKTIQINSNQPIEDASIVSIELCKVGTIIADEGNLVKALEKYNLALENDPNNPIALFNRATVKLDLGDVEGARDDFLTLDSLKNESLTIRYEYQTSFVKTIYNRFV